MSTVERCCFGETGHERGSLGQGVNVFVMNSIE